MKKKKEDSPITVVGITTDGKECLGGIFEMAATYGFPLPASMVEAERMGAVISWETYMKDALKAGWPIDRAFKAIRAAFRETGTPVPLRDGRDVFEVWEEAQSTKYERL